MLDPMQHMDGLIREKLFIAGQLVNGCFMISGRASDIIGFIFKKLIELKVSIGEGHHFIARAMEEIFGYIGGHDGIFADEAIHFICARRAREIESMFGMGIYEKRRKSLMRSSEVFLGVICIGQKSNSRIDSGPLTSSEQSER